MDTNRLKKFATEARNILKAGIAAKLTGLGFNRKGEVPEILKPQLLQGGTLWNGQTFPEGFYHQWMRLYEQVQAKGVNEVYEQAAYTWFNRLVAIRILQKNGLCEPVSTYADSARTPQIVNQARQGLFPPMEEVAKRHLLELLDDDTKVTEQFAVLLVAWCHANPILQRCFGTMEDYTELLLPANILAENGFIDLLNHTEFITDEEFRSPELIGWLYQFYISERKDEVFAKKGKFEADEIPAATQIFTPNWIVKYMVQNTVGRIYLDNNPSATSMMKSKWQYLVDSAEPTPADAVLHYNELTDLKVADLACGSGHILNECFDLLYDLYITEGYTRSEAITHIFMDNLTGIDLDPRAQQLSLFALTLKACQHDHSFADAHCLPRVLTMPKVQLPLPTDTRLAVEIDAVNALLEDADSLGSIMKFNLTPAAWEWVASLVTENEAAALVIALAEQYDALVMNPPYMGGGNMNEVLSKYVKKNYEDGKADLFSVFMELAIDRLKAHGRYGMINMQSWMFLSSFEKLRKTLLDNCHIESMLHLGSRTFDELSGEVVQNTTFVVAKHNANRSGAYFRLVEGKCCVDKERMFLHTVEQGAKIYYPNVLQENFEKIPGCPIGYWVSEKFLSRFAGNLALSPVCKPTQGLATGDNARFLRLWSEVNLKKIGFHMNSSTDAYQSGFKWFLVTKGGGFRRWYGNIEYVVNWENNGFEIKNFKDEKGKLRSRPQNEDYYFSGVGASWSTISSGKPSFRFFNRSWLFETKGSVCFPKKQSDVYKLIGYLNSPVVFAFLQTLSPTLDYHEGPMGKVPYEDIEGAQNIENLVKTNIEISKSDWDSHETSWDFQQNELISLIDCTEKDLTIESLTSLCSFSVHSSTEKLQAYENPHAVRLQDLMEHYHTKWNTLFAQLHANEEELNRQFIDIYGLQDELTPDVPLDEITILQQGEISIEKEN
ncbi:BREX-1 system adenine-specific DNA-methyltransferase PglX [Bacteroides cellulosilyticus]|uniref:BREX-1 system adenine-specific DNA-methyltransferase PglX n=1 Tax=Bacteroides cellulosilyticus TaxID=246787 RepID=UPI00076BFF81|nr:BREX-1 system adenine-specific DNA-methyltransferase PglX [Bacteroides cellulosilyticus]KWR59159.1 Eco57I-like type IIS restriction enzyme [Bacteroides cellulosilyticus]